MSRIDNIRAQLDVLEREGTIGPYVLSRPGDRGRVWTISGRRGSVFAGLSLSTREVEVLLAGVALMRPTISILRDQRDGLELALDIAHTGITSP